MDWKIWGYLVVFGLILGIMLVKQYWPSYVEDNVVEEKIEDIINITSFFSIIAHAPGRLRVRVNPKIVNETSNISLKDIENLPTKIDGISDIKINKIIASVTITYDPDVFKPKLWEDLIKNENLNEITILINKLKKEVI